MDDAGLVDSVPAILGEASPELGALAREYIRLGVEGGKPPRQAVWGLIRHIEGRIARLKEVRDETRSQGL